MSKKIFPLLFIMSIKTPCAMQPSQKKPRKESPQRTDGKQVKNLKITPIDWGEHGVGDSDNELLLNARQTVRSIAENIIEKGCKEGNTELSKRKNIFNHSKKTLVCGLRFSCAGHNNISGEFETPWGTDALMAYDDEDNSISTELTPEIAKLFQQELCQNGFLIEEKKYPFLTFHVTSINGIPVREPKIRPVASTSPSAQKALNKAEAQFITKAVTEFIPVRSVAEIVTYYCLDDLTEDSDGDAQMFKVND